MVAHVSSHLEWKINHSGCPLDIFRQLIVIQPMQRLRSGLREFLVTIGFQVHGLPMSRRTYYIQFNGKNCFQFTWPAQYGVVSRPERRYCSIL